MVFVLMIDFLNIMVYTFAVIPIASREIQLSALDSFGQFFDAYKTDKNEPLATDFSKPKGKLRFLQK